MMESICRFFFFQAEDGIRDLTVTGVQTCALPISTSWGSTGATPERPVRSCAAAPGRPSRGRALERLDEGKAAFVQRPSHNGAGQAGGADRLQVGERRDAPEIGRAHV